MADEETPAPEKTPVFEAGQETAPEPEPEAASEPAPEEGVETEAQEQTVEPEEEVVVREEIELQKEEAEVIGEELTETVEASAPEHEDEGTGPEEELPEDEPQEKEEDEDMKDYLPKSDSADNFVKSSSIQIGPRESDMQEPGILSSSMLIDKKEKHASRAKEVLGEVIDIRRGSLGAEAYDKRTIRYMNTYKLDSDNPFNYEKVNKILEIVMTEAMQDLKYDPEKCSKQAKWASNTIKAKVKQLEFERYKIISLVSIGEKHNQDVMCACRFLWDVDRDNYGCYTIENAYIFGIALCFGLYYE